MAASGNVVPAGKEIIFQKVVRFDAPPQAVYDVLADINTHFVWGGTKGKKNFQLTGIQAASAPAQKGSEFSSTGIAPAGTFRDRSVVTEASPPAAFEFLTDSHVSFKKGKEGVWAVINRYEITPDGAGSRVAYTQRVTSATNLGPLKMALNPILAPMVRMMVGGSIKASLASLGAMAKDRGR